MDATHTQPQLRRKNGAVEAAPRRRPSVPPWALPALRVLAGTACALAIALAQTAPASADETLRGTCYVTCTNAHIDGAGGGNVFDVEFPQYGIRTTGYCISGSRFGTPMPGFYPYTGEPVDDGGYLVTVNCRGAAMYENHYSPFGAQNVGGFKIYPTGAVEVAKRSAAPDVTAGNPCYALGGAVFGIYADEACTERLSSVTTGADGRGRSEPTLAPGTYWVRELEAPAGFARAEEPVRTDLSRADCAAQTAALATVEDAPLLAAADVLARKVDRDTGEASPAGDATLAGAVFEVAHYAGRYATGEDVAAADAQPTRRWTVVTDAQGRASLAADDLFSDGRGGRGLPLGTVVVREVRAPEGYLLPEPAVFLEAVEASGTEGGPPTAAYHAPIVPEQVVRGDVALFKFGSGGQGADADGGPVTPLANVSFDIVRISTGELAARITTDEAGRASTRTSDGNAEGGALPFGAYEVREDPATTPAGYQAAAPFPVVVSEHGALCAYEVENVANAVPPAPESQPGPPALAATGDSPAGPLLGAALAATAALCAAAVPCAAGAAAGRRRSRPPNAKDSRPFGPGVSEMPL